MPYREQGKKVKVMNYLGQNPYYQYQASPFVAAMQQNYGNPIQPQVQPQQQQQTISTQPPILQQQTGIKIIPVSNREEATGTPIDLVNGTPTFFYNKSKNEIYLKQFDVPTGTAVFKTYGEMQIIEEPVEQQNDYKKELHYISEGIDNLHRMLANLQPKEEVIEIEPEKKGKKNA